MAHSGPDYDLSPSVQAYPAAGDLAELASRINRGMGGLQRAGHVLYMTSWRDGLGEIHGRLPIGPNASIGLWTAQTEYGPNALKLTTGSNVNNQTGITRNQPGGFSSRLGFEITVWNVNTTHRFYLLLRHYPGGLALNEYAWRFTVSGNTTELAYETTAGAFTVWQTLGVPIYGGYFHDLKMIVDTTKNRYATLLINGQSQGDVSALVPNIATIVAPGVFPNFQLNFKNECRVAATNQTVFLGSMIFTIDEP